MYPRSSVSVESGPIGCRFHACSLFVQRKPLGAEMTGEVYQARGAAIRKREENVRRQIDGVIAAGTHPDNPILRPLIDNHQSIIDELSALNREALGDA